MSNKNLPLFPEGRELNTLTRVSPIPIGDCQELWPTLDDIERQISWLVQDGYSVEKIAGRLNTSAEEIQQHVQHILELFELNSVDALQQMMQSIIAEY